MIKKATDITCLGGVSSPLLPLVYTDFLYADGGCDGLYLQFDGEGCVCTLVSIRGCSATVLKTGDNCDIPEISAFLSLCGITSVVSDFSANFSGKKLCVLMCAFTQNARFDNVFQLENGSSVRDYKGIYNLLSPENGGFEKWFPVFSKKINNRNAFAVFFAENGSAQSVAVANAVYDGTAVISGVFTAPEHRGSGKGGASVKSLLSELHRANVKTAYLWCERKNVPFYEKTGFTACGEVYYTEDF